MSVCEDQRMGMLALEGVAPPKKITQQAFEGDDRHLRRLVRLRSGQRAEASDLWEYTRYSEIQGPLLAYFSRN